MSFDEILDLTADVLKFCNTSRPNVFCIAPNHRPRTRDIPEG